MMGPTLDVHDPMAMQLRLELRRATPRGVLSALIGENLARRSVVGYPARERLEHQRTTLVMRKGETDKVTRVIVQESRHVQPLVLAQ
jgi:hypothetical protein